MLSLALKQRLCLIGFLLAATAKFWLAWQSEIADALDDPHEYVLQILYPANGGLDYPPGTGLAGQFLHFIGIPFRLGIEAAFIIAAALVVRALFAWPWRSVLALALFVLTIFNPAPAELFSHLFSDQIWLIATLLALACFVLALEAAPDLKGSWLFPSAFFFGFSTITRSVLVPDLLALIAFTTLGILLFRTRRHLPKARQALPAFSIAVWAVLLGFGIIYGGLSRYNTLRHGYSGICYIDSAEYKKFYLCLQSVGEPTGVKYFPIDEERRQLIAQAGPDSRWFVRQLDDNTVYQQVGLDHYGKYDIPAGWFHWAAFTATVKNGDYLPAFAVFRSIEDEIATAHRMGVVKVRPILPLPDCRTAIVASALPDALRNIVTQMVHEPAPAAFDWKIQNPHYLDDDFNRALHRRTVAESPIRESIWGNLCVIYSWIYQPVTFYFLLVVLVVFLFTLTLKWNRIDLVSPGFVARQIFLVLFLVLIHWYALFDASGMPVVARYMIFNQVMLPLLIAYYITETVRLLGEKGQGG